MQFKPRNYIVVSDIHLGVRGTPAQGIIDNLYKLFDDFDDKSEKAKLSAVFFAGDIWHDTLTLSSTVLHAFFPFWYALVKWASRNNIAIRVLKGTPRHDRDQDKTIATLVEALDLDIDYKYVEELSIEFMDRLGMHVLYVPDECRPTAAQIQEDVEILLKEENLVEVDIAIMHGMFEHQLGTIPFNNKVLSTEYFLSIVRYFINIGHIHRPSQYDRILAQGSFDCISHGEEHDKGAYMLIEESLNSWIPVFLVNENSKIFKTIEVDDDADVAHRQIAEGVKNLVPYSHVRIAAKANHALFKGFKELEDLYPQFTWTKKPLEDKSKPTISTITSKPIQGVNLNKDTLVSLIVSEVKEMEKLTDNEESKLSNLLEDLHA